MKSASTESIAQARYWDELADDYQRETSISLSDFHYGPLLPGDRELQLLPPNLAGMSCLELGCGAAQNSLVLAARGARCLALDISAAQISHARALAARCALPLDARVGDMDALPSDLGPFDLIHSAYGFPFSRDPAALLQRCAALLRPGGRLLFSMGHPVYAGDWMELDDDERGIVLSRYFHPSPDLREGESPEAESCARAFPLSETVAWIRAAGLRLLDLREPPALPVQQMSPAERAERVPYFSPAWAEQVEELRRFPIVAIFLAEKAPA
jgi:SAM-dependent methyltransferase